MRRPSPRRLADAFLWIGLLLFLFGVSDVLPSASSSSSLSSPSSWSPLSDGAMHDLRETESPTYLRHVDHAGSEQAPRVAGNRHLRSVVGRDGVHAATTFRSHDAPRQAMRADRVASCQFTRTDAHLVADSNGRLCAPSAQLPSGCCNPSTSSTSPSTSSSSSSSSSFSSGRGDDAMGVCASCDRQWCCAAYEQCVGCCLQPDQAGARAAIEKHVSMRRYAMRSPFDLCAAVCRSGSSSVVHENAYKHSRHHCFGLIAPEVDPSLHSGVFDFAIPLSINNNNN